MRGNTEIFQQLIRSVSGSELQDLVLSAPVDNFKFYVSETDNNTALEANSLYFNNLNVVPEPSVFAFLAGILALNFAVRRRR